MGPQGPNGSRAALTSERSIGISVQRSWDRIRMHESLGQALHHDFGPLDPPAETVELTLDPLEEGLLLLFHCHDPLEDPSHILCGRQRAHRYTPQ